MADLNPNSSAGRTNIATGVQGGGGSGGGSGIASGAVSGAGAGAMFGPWGALAGGIIGAGVSIFGGNPREESTEAIMKKLEEAEEYLKSTPFTKDEIMNQLLPQAQKMYRGAAKTLAGTSGAAVGESDVAKGQAFGEYYANTIAPTIAAGEENAANAIERYGQWFSGLDAAGKDRFLSTIKTLMAGTQGLSSMGDAQKGVIGGLEGARLGAGIAGEFDIMGEMSTRGQLDKGLDQSILDFIKSIG